MPVRNAEAVWEGNLREGKGTMKFGSFEGPYTHASRFASGEGTNPEELVGAALAGCFSMFLSLLLTKNNTPPTRIFTEARVHLVDGPTIERVELRSDVAAAGVEQDRLDALVQEAKQNCPVSKALGSVQITVDATLQNR
jgi:osmotically inducible protein OsmC